MNKALRQFLVIFIFACIIMLAVLVVQVFILGERAEPEAELPAVIGSSLPPAETQSPPASTGESAPPTTESEPPDDESPDGPDDAANESPPPEGMERVPLPLPGHGTLLIDYYDDVFTHVEQDYGDLFMYISPGGGDASMTVLTKSNQTAAEAAEHFFDDAEPDETLPGGPQSIGQTGLTGHYVKALLGDETFEAWLIDVEGGIVAFSIKYNDNEQMEALYALISAMQLAQ